MPRPARLWLILALAAPPALAVQPGFRLYADEFALQPLQHVKAGLRLENASLAPLTASGAATGAALEALSAWDFRPAATLAGSTVSVSQTVPAASAWTCYLPDTLQCGFGASDVDALFVEDSTVAGAANRDVSSASYDEATGILRGRASVASEGTAAELRLCLGTTANAPLVPVAAFPNVDGGRRFMRAGDPAWQSPVFNCVDAATLGAPCRATGGQRAALASRSGQTEGRMRGRVVRAGTLTLPSGHVLDALLVEGFTSYTARSAGNPCILDLLTVRQWHLAWVVPRLGTVLSLTSPSDVAQLSSFNLAAGTFLGFGLLPPLSLRATAVDTDTVTVAWDPGLLGERFIDGYEVHWGPQPARTSPPAFHSGPLPAGTTSYRVEGLTAGQLTHVSVTTFRSYRDPVSGVTTRYESLSAAEAIGADTNGDGRLDHVYPAELAVATTPTSPCVAGDLVADGLLQLDDIDRGRALVVGTSPAGERDLQCADWAPGAAACAPADQPARWCASADGRLRCSDLVALLAKMSGRLALACSGCPS